MAIVEGGEIDKLGDLHAGEPLVEMHRSIPENYRGGLRANSSNSTYNTKTDVVDRLVIFVHSLSHSDPEVENTERAMALNGLGY
jgi:hypothetical protein